eukprot:SAG11_NODE_3468_length_2429_cov_18.805579_3_plen_142_part_00
MRAAAAAVLGCFGAHAAPYSGALVAYVEDEDFGWDSKEWKVALATLQALGSLGPDAAGAARHAAAIADGVLAEGSEFLRDDQAYAYADLVLAAVTALAKLGAHAAPHAGVFGRVLLYEDGVDCPVVLTVDAKQVSRPRQRN